MTPQFYQFLHLLGIMGVFTALGAVTATDCRKCISAGTALHGISLLFILVAGFGMQAKMSLGFPVWLIVKLGLWVALGGMIAVAKRKPIPRVAILTIILFLGGFSAFLGIFKPF